MFRCKADILDAGRAVWVEDRMAWVLDRIGPTDTPLFLTTKEFSTAGSGTDHATAEAVLAEIARLKGMEDWPLHLMAVPDLDEGIWLGCQPLTQTCGTLELTEKGAIIRYMPSQLKAPQPYISTMAHCWLAPHRHGCPGGNEQHELATDHTFIAHGFGIFQMMTADAWGWAKYLGQRTRAYALALFLWAKGESADDACALLAGRPRKLLDRALSQLNCNLYAVACLREKCG